MQHIDFTITQSSLDHGRLYFEGTPKGFFPTDVLGGRGSADLAQVAVCIVAGDDAVQTDIRVSSTVRLSPRKSFRLWLRSVQAVAGGSARLHKTAEREYRLQYIG